jgi:hypothetical protein
VRRLLQKFSRVLPKPRIIMEREGENGRKDEDKVKGRGEAMMRLKVRVEKGIAERMTAEKKQVSYR